MPLGQDLKIVIKLSSAFLKLAIGVQVGKRKGSLDFSNKPVKNCRSRKSYSLEALA
jgi:hypothetical protein